MIKKYAKYLTLVLGLTLFVSAIVGCGSKAADVTEITDRFDTSNDSVVETVNDEVKEDIVFPEKYSLIDEKRSTAYKNQHQSGMCWAYSVAAVAESALITAGFESEEVDLSEGHICYSVYPYAEERSEGSTEDGIYVLGEKNKILLNPYYAGGSPVNAMQLFAVGAGPIYEEEFPVDTDAGRLKISIENAMEMETERKICKNMGKYLLTEYDLYESNEDIKYGLMNYGAVSAGVFINENGLGYDSNKEACYYYTDMTNPPADTNHVVTIVGWDDTYSKDNFNNIKPQNDGAWLIKDSISSNLNYRNTGYYWLSYDEYHMGNATMKLSKRDDYGTIMSYETIWLEDSIKTEGEYTVVANCFNIETDSSIEAVGIGTCNPNQIIDLEIFVNSEDGKPDSGQLAYADNITVDYMGYKVIDINEVVEAKVGDRISVVLKYHNIEGQKGTAPVEGDTNALNLGGLGELYIVSNPGESYALKEGIWYDLAKSESASAFDKTGTINNARIKLIMNK